ncbi:MAG TPA: EVE domain-containing protein [Alphaproteobacteria bacterium]|nr:ubiquinol-cytochrome C reductase [Paracoccaceae bacterium]RCL78523.1 MAG: EVE domain-containing protein [SAR116 cluster bacterium]RPH13882.1 MAG: EVE domain-containing protein [Alphaproteobacteria bacterium TMED150]HCJ61168.1 EVE domain-containing protein [Alphaproteobacteria bacterium]HCY48430.1 EVE domain-containing protein [Alphaproteobacteria bacterium]
MVSGKSENYGYWIYKSEPNTWSWDQQVAKGDVGEGWDGVRNHQASNNMKSMQLGDLGFFYHSVNEKRIVGVVEVIAPYQPDHTDPTGKWGMVTLKALTPVPNPITLAEIKQNPQLEGLSLIKQSRLSVVPVSDEHWDILCSMCGFHDIPRKS